MQDREEVTPHHDATDYADKVDAWHTRRRPNRAFGHFPNLSQRHQHRTCRTLRNFAEVAKQKNT